MTQTHTLTPAAAAPVSTFRVAIVGATGYAGQELVRLLARHPHARLTQATGSQATSTPRRLPALARIWDGEVVPLDLQSVRAAADIVFLALPEAASADAAPALLAAGARVIDLSGAFRLRDDAARANGTRPPRRCRPVSSMASPSSPPRRFPARRWCRALAVIPRRRCWPCSRWPRPGCSATTPTSSSTPSRASPAPARRRRIARTSARTTAAWPPTACSGTGTRPRWRRRSAATSPSHRTWCRSIAACSPPCTRALTPGTTADPGAGGAEAAHAAVAVRAAHRRRAARNQARRAWSNFCDIGWRVDEASGRIVLVSALDNLVKGAAGQAVQNFNLLIGADERTGLL